LGELDVKFYFVTCDELTAAVAGSITPAAAECFTAKCGRKLSGAQALTNPLSYFGLFHRPCFAAIKGLRFDPAAAFLATAGRFRPATTQPPESPAGSGRRLLGSTSVHCLPPITYGMT
jgi:hypothetical protein